MNNREVFNKTNELSIKIKKKRDELDELVEDIRGVQDSCDHEVVFKLNNDTPRMLIIDGYYYCPACGKSYEVIDHEDLQYTQFAKSKVVDLTELSLLPNDTVYSEIRNEVYENYDFYYGANTSIEDMKTKMLETMRPRDLPFQKQKDILKRIREKKVD